MQPPRSPPTGVSIRMFGRGRCGWTAATQPQRSPVQQSLPNDEATAARAPARPVGFATGPPLEQPATTAEAAALAVEAKSTELALQYTGHEVYVDETVFLVGTKTGKSVVCGVYYVIGENVVAGVCVCVSARMRLSVLCASCEHRVRVCLFVCCSTHVAACR